MKMNWFMMFFGILFVLWGIGMIVKAVFGINLPLGSVFFGLFIIFIGIKIIFPGSFKGCCNMGSMGFTNENTVIFGESHTEYKTGEYAQYDVVFGKQVVDLSKVDASKGNVNVKINTVFGETQIKISEKTPLKIVGNSAFGSLELPNGNNTAFGQNFYKSASYKEGSPALTIDANVVFGGIIIK